MNYFIIVFIRFHLRLILLHLRSSHFISLQGIIIGVLQRNMENCKVFAKPPLLIGRTRSCDVSSRSCFIGWFWQFIPADRTWSDLYLLYISFPNIISEWKSWISFSHTAVNFSVQINSFRSLSSSLTQFKFSHQISINWITSHMSSDSFNILLQIDVNFSSIAVSKFGGFPPIYRCTNNISTMSSRPILTMKLWYF